jgi:ribosomal protein S18 acetylase RimI-like enzyme
MNYISAISQARKDDISEISSFFENAAFIHRHLDWHSTLDWLGSQPFLMLKANNEIQAILAAPPDPPHTAWIHCFATRDNSVLDAAWKALFAEASITLASLNAIPYAVGLEDWFCTLLLNNGFQAKQNIVVLSWNHHVQPLGEASMNLLLRPMLESDLHEVANVDAHSFEKQWVTSESSIRLAYLQCQHKTVAEIDGKLVGYELSTANQYSAHLARLAVLPEYRRGMIAKRLVTDMLHHFSRQGVLQVTVNTQSDNSASINLYKGLGFELTGETIPVLSFG